MKKTLKLIYLSLLALVLIFSACKSDDDATELTLQDLELTIDENPTNGQTLGTVQANVGSSSNFSIVNQNPEGALAINANTGELSVADFLLFDFEQNPIITANISADGASNTGTVTINLNDLNEITSLDLNFAVDENPNNGQTISTIEANGSATLSFNIVNQTPDGALDLNSSTGELSVADSALFDFEVNPVITASVSVSGSENTATVTINLNDLDEISVQDLSVSIDENPTDGQSIGTVQAAGTGTLSFSITSQTPIGALEINTNTGELTVADPNLFDFETNPVITANISVTNAVNVQTLTATISLNNANELNAYDLNVTMDEDPNNGQFIGSLQADGDGTLSFSITTESLGGAFTINSSTGAVFVNSGSLFDFESSPVLTAIITVDNSVQTTTVNVTVTLNNVDEIGDFNHGGVIFWLDGNGGGLACNINDLNGGVGAAWNNGSNINTGANETAIGTGQANTNAIVASQGAGTYAAWLCAALQLNNYSDWYLPSKDELTQMYVNQTAIDATAIANGGANFSSYYWTSSEQNGNANNAWYQFFFNGQQALNAKSNMAWIRAIRAF